MTVRLCLGSPALRGCVRQSRHSPGFRAAAGLAPQSRPPLDQALGVGRRVKESLVPHTNTSLCGSACLLPPHGYMQGGGHCTVGILAPPLEIPAEPPPPSAAPLIRLRPLLSLRIALCLWQWTLGLSEEQEKGSDLGGWQRFFLNL